MASEIEFSWTDDETQLLLESALQYKNFCEYKGINWESTKLKYEKVLTIFKQSYPSTDGDNDKYPHFDGLENAITKDRVAAKFKRIRTNFKKAADAGKRSGGGRIIFTFYDLCNDLWGKSPSVTSLASGIDSNSSANSSEKNNDSSDNESDNEEEEDEGSPAITSTPFVTKKKQVERRQNVAEFLKERKTAKMSNKTPREEQMMAYIKEDIELKKQLLETFQKSNNELMVRLNKANENVASISMSMEQSVGLLSQLLTPSNPVTPPPYPRYTAVCQFIVMKTVETTMGPVEAANNHLP